MKNTHISPATERVAMKRHHQIDVNEQYHHAKKCENSNNSGTANACVTSHIVSEFYEAQGGGREVHGELGEQGNRKNGAPVPKIFARPSPTPLYTKNSHISTTNECVTMKKMSSSSVTSEKIERFGQELKELWSNHSKGGGGQHGVGGDMDAQGELGEQGTGEDGPPNPEIFQILSYRTFLQKMGYISGCTEAIMMKNIPLRRSCRVELESQFTRGTDEWSSICQFNRLGQGRLQEQNIYKERK
ncbi:hypothetical protein EDC04DRAFT_3095463 [Pisolithus marmoratus]|nr:hypothetical protein EDC04DRAFT_3095463 [Pisolithus marmoratus]